MKDTSVEATIVENPPHKAAERPSAQPWREVIDNRWIVLALLLFVTAAFGLPLLWMSRAFSIRAKVTLTFVALAWTALVFWAFFVIMAWCCGQVSEALGWQ